MSTYATKISDADLKNPHRRLYSDIKFYAGCKAVLSMTRFSASSAVIGLPQIKP